ncbi:MAG: hypothetical protein AAF742_08965 [Pseudomonadota bacterium]
MIHKLLLASRLMLVGFLKRILVMAQRLRGDTMHTEQTASVPTSGDAGRHGRRASPTNPTEKTGSCEEKRSEKIDLRCTKTEKAVIKAEAVAAGVSASQLMREALGLADAKRRKPMPTIAPDIARAVARTTRDVQ